MFTKKNSINTNTEFNLWSLIDSFMGRKYSFSESSYEIKYENAYIIFTGLNPNEELHTTYLNIEPMTGNK